MRRRSRLVVLAALLCTLVLGVLVEVQISPALSRHNTISAPSAAASRQASFASFQLADGSILQFRHSGPNEDSMPEDEILLARDGLTLDRLPLHEVLDEWLHEDRYWSDHEQANQVRYQRDNAGGNISGIIHKVDYRASDLLVEIQWCLRFGSWHSVQAMHLARVTPGPRIQVEFLQNRRFSPWVSGSSADQGDRR